MSQGNKLNTKEIGFVTAITHDKNPIDRSVFIKSESENAALKAAKKKYKNQ